MDQNEVSSMHHWQIEVSPQIKLLEQIAAAAAAKTDKVQNPENIT